MSLNLELRTVNQDREIQKDEINLRKASIGRIKYLSAGAGAAGGGVPKAAKLAYTGASRGLHTLRNRGKKAQLRYLSKEQMKQWNSYSKKKQERLLAKTERLSERSTQGLEEAKALHYLLESKKNKERWEVLVPRGGTSRQMRKSLKKGDLDKVVFYTDNASKGIRKARRLESKYKKTVKKEKKKKQKAKAASLGSLIDQDMRRSSQIQEQLKNERITQGEAEDAYASQSAKTVFLPVRAKLSIWGGRIGRHLTTVAVKAGETILKAALPLCPPLLVILLLVSFIGGISGGSAESGSGAVASYGFLGTGEISELGLTEIPPEYLDIYYAAAERYSVPWNLLAAIHKVETDFGRSLGVSSAGAMGHMQFMPQTWVGWLYPSSFVPDAILKSLEMIARYGGYGVDADGDGIADPWNASDAIHAAAKYLSANGAGNGNYYNAIYAYNHADWYVQEVMGIAASYVVAASGSFLWPVPASYTTVSSQFGMRWHPIDGVYKMHNGIDIPIPYGTEIYASQAGMVTAAAYDSSMGNYVMIDHGSGILTIYMHNSSLLVNAGSLVVQGQVIAKGGSTGASTGNHCHFSVKVNGEHVNPMGYFK